jgi:hypothetical protein
MALKNSSGGFHKLSSMKPTAKDVMNRPGSTFSAQCVRMDTDVS